MPTVFERAGTATKELRKVVIGGGSFAVAGLGLPATAAGVSAMLPAAGAAAVVTAGAAFVAPFLVIGGLVVAGSGIGVGIYKTLWPTSRVKAHRKKIAELKELDNPYWSCHIHRIGVIGIKRTGKSEIKNRLGALGTAKRDTMHIETHVLHADKDEGIFIALIDGQGAEVQEREQQFEIADQSDVLVIVLDHNDSNERCDIDDGRLGAHVTFLQQIQERLKEARKASGDKKKIRVIFVLNKKDLWSQAKDVKFMSWFQKCAQEWSETGISVGEASMEMSATKEPKDIEELKRKIVTAARQLKK